MTAGSSKLELFSESTFSSPVSAGLLAGSPTVDLAAAVNDENTLSIWRAGSQLVTRYNERAKAVQAIRWKADGNFLAVAWSDGVVRLMGLENSKAVHHLRIAESGATNVAYVAWSRNLTGKRPASSNSGKDSWRSALDDGSETGADFLPLDLPHELTFLEVDASLPKISPLPVSGGSGEDMFVFSTSTSLDFIFRSFKPEENDAVDVMTVGTTDGSIHLSIYDSFTIGTFNPSFQSVDLNSGPLVLVAHASHPDVSTHALLFKPSNDTSQPIYLVPMDLCFVASSAVNLSLLASKTTTLQNLLRYIKQTQVHMAGEWKSTRELPAKFLANIQEDLEKSYEEHHKGPSNIVQALYHTVVTGHTYPVVREWLVDSLAERGHKRWDKAVTSGLESLRALVHENMIPALERAAVVLSRLLGLARFHAGRGRDDVGLGAARVARLLDAVSCLLLAAHRVLAHVMDELDHFAVFSAWLRFQIDRLASASASQAADELSDKEATMDHAKVLAYLRRYLLASPLAAHLDEVAADEWEADWARVEDGGPSLLEMLDRQLGRLEAGQSYMRAFPHVDFLVAYLSSKAGILFKDIAEAEKRSVRFFRPTKMAIPGGIAKSKAMMCAGPKEGGADGLIYTVATPKGHGHDNRIYIFRTELVIINGISSATSTSALGLALGAGRVIDTGFLGQNVLLVLWAPAKGRPPVLLRVPVRSPQLPFADYADGGGAAMAEPLALSEDEVRASLAPLDLGLEPGFAPVQMEVLGARRERGEVPARVGLLGRDRVTYKVFGLPGDAAGAGTG